MNTNALAGLKIAGLTMTHMAFTTLANIGFKLSSGKESFWGFWSWQIVGNLAGFAAVLALTRMLRYTPLHVAYPLVQGLGVIAVQLVAARLFFHETFQPLQWVGTVFIIAGIVLIGSQVKSGL